MTANERRARIWCGAACAFAQVAATAAGMVPWWALPITLALTVAVSQPTGPVDPKRAILTRNAGVASVAVFSTIIAMRTISQGREGIVDPTSTLRSLSEALVVLSLIMAPQARTPREHRVWLTVTTGVLVAAAAFEGRLELEQYGGLPTIPRLRLHRVPAITSDEGAS